jgi:hypothetical protein
LVFHSCLRISSTAPHASAATWNRVERDLGFG